MYRLVNGQYILQPGDKKWMPKIGLGIGREQGTYQGRTLDPNILYSSFQSNRPHCKGAETAPLRLYCGLCTSLNRKPL